MSKKPDTSHLTCGGCWKNGTLEEVLPGNQIAEAWYQCKDKGCSWAGPAGQAKRPKREPSMSEEIEACRLEDEARGTPGSSGGSKGPTRQVVSAGKFRPRRAWDDGIKQKTERVGPAKSKVVRWGKWTLRITEQEYETLLKVAKGKYPQGLKGPVARALGHEPEDVTDVLSAFRTLCLEFFSQTS